MTTLRGMFDPKPRTKRNFLLENIREVCKDKQRKNCQIKSQKLILPNSQSKASQPKAKAYSPPRQRFQEPTQNRPVNARQHLLKQSCVSTHIPRGNSCLSTGRSESYSQTQNEIHSSYEQRCSGNRDFAREELDLPAHKFSYIDEENIPFRWTQVCPSIISHTVCHQAVQTVKEEDLDSLLQEGSIKYPSFHKHQPPEETKNKVLSVLERPESTEDDISHLRYSEKGESIKRHVDLEKPLKRKAANTAGNKVRPAGKPTRCQPSYTERGVGPCVPELVDNDQCSTRGSVPVEGKLVMIGSPDSRDRGSEFSTDAKNDEMDNIWGRTLEKPSLSHISIDLAGSLDQLDGFEKATDKDLDWSKRTGLPPRLQPFQQKGVLVKYVPPSEQTSLKSDKRNDISNEVQIAPLNEAQKLIPKATETLRVSSEQDRRKKIEDASTAYETLVGELNRMPVRTDTLRTKRRKMEIEKELDLLERRIRALTRISEACN